MTVSANNKPRPGNAITWERRFQAFELHKAGWSERAIANQQGVSPATSHKDIKLVLQSLAPDAADVEEVRTTQNQRYMTILRSIWAAVLRGDLPAIDRAEKIMRGINTINGLNKAATGLPGSTEGNPLWVTMSELAQAIPTQGYVVEAGETPVDLDTAMLGMYTALPEPHSNLDVLGTNGVAETD